MMMTIDDQPHSQSDQVRTGSQNAAMAFDKLKVLGQGAPQDGRLAGRWVLDDPNQVPHDYV